MMQAFVVACICAMIIGSTSARSLKAATGDSEPSQLLQDSLGAAGLAAQPALHFGINPYAFVASGQAVPVASMKPAPDPHSVSKGVAGQAGQPGCFAATISITNTATFETITSPAPPDANKQVAFNISLYGLQTYTITTMQHLDQATLSMVFMPGLDQTCYDTQQGFQRCYPARRVIIAFPGAVSTVANVPILDASDTGKMQLVGPDRQVLNVTFPMPTSPDMVIVTPSVVIDVQQGTCGLNAPQLHVYAGVVQQQPEWQYSLPDINCCMNLRTGQLQLSCKQECSLPNRSVELGRCWAAGLNRCSTPSSAEPQVQPGTLLAADAHEAASYAARPHIARQLRM